MIVHGSRTEASARQNALSLVEEIGHRVVNEYAEAISMLSLAASLAISQVEQETLVKVADRLRDHADSHRALLPPFIEGPVNLADYLGQICCAYTKATLSSRGVRLVLKIDEILQSADRCWRIGLVVSELVRNAARHGLSGRHGLIMVRVTEQKGLLTCLVCDTGQSVAKATPGRGQRLIRALVSDLGGNVDWSFTPHGGTAYLEIPDDGSTAAAPMVAAGHRPRAVPA